MCKKKACRRTRACGGAVDECGTRCCPQRWTWLHRVVKTIRNGRSRRAAVWAADQHALGRSKQITVKAWYRLPAETYWVDEDGKPTGPDRPHPHLVFGTQLRRLIGSAWLRAVPRGEGED